MAATLKFKVISSVIATLLINNSLVLSTETTQSPNYDLPTAMAVDKTLEVNKRNNTNSTIPELLTSVTTPSSLASLSSSSSAAATIRTTTKPPGAVETNTTTMKTMTTSTPLTTLTITKSADTLTSTARTIAAVATLTTTTKATTETSSSSTTSEFSPDITPSVPNSTVPSLWSFETTVPESTTGTDSTVATSVASYSNNYPQITSSLPGTTSFRNTTPVRNTSVANSTQIISSSPRTMTSNSNMTSDSIKPTSSSNTTLIITTLVSSISSEALNASILPTPHLKNGSRFPHAARTCVVGAVAPQDPADLSIFQQFKAPSQPPEVPDWEMALKITFYALSFLMTVVGNTMVVVIICSNRRMRTTTNILLLNQAISDLMVAAVCMWVHLGNSITPEWPFGPYICKVNTFCQVVAVTASVLTMTAISVERFTAIVFPLKAKWSAVTSGIIITVTWLMAAAVASPHLFVRHMYQQHWKDRHEVWCAEEWPQVYKDESCNTYEPGKVAYYFIEGIVMYLVPVLIMIVAYSFITYRLVTRQIPGTLINSTISAQEKAKRKVIKMLVAVLVCFVVCWTPQQIMLLYDIFRQHDQVPLYVNTVKYVALYVAYFNSALNPILYGGFNDNFRRGFRDVFVCRKFKNCNKVHPADTGGSRRRDRDGGTSERRGGGGAEGGGREGDGGGSTPRTTTAPPTPQSNGNLTPNLQHSDRRTLQVSESSGTSSSPVTHRFNISEAAKTSALFGQSQHPSRATSASCQRRHSARSDKTTHVAWQATQ